MENDLFHYTGIAFRTFQCYTFQQIYRLAVPSHARACLKIAFCQMCVPLCGTPKAPFRGLGPNKGGVRPQDTAKWGVQIAGMNFQTRSRAGGKRRLLYVQNVGKIDEK